MCGDDAIALGIKRDCADGGPVAGVAGPTRWVAFAGLEVQGMTSGQDGDIATVVSPARVKLVVASVMLLKAGRRCS